VTKNEAADAAGLKVYDTAIPQSWLECVSQDPGGSDRDARMHIYDIVRSGTVWCYDGPHRVFGAPYPLTDEARRAIAQYDALHGSHYAEAFS
jgi:hypothetical protein